MCTWPPITLTLTSSPFSALVLPIKEMTILVLIYIIIGHTIYRHSLCMFADSESLTTPTLRVIWMYQLCSQIWQICHFQKLHIYCIYIHIYYKFNKNLKGFRNVWKSIETSGDMSQCFIPSHFLKIRSFKPLAEWSWVHSRGFRTSDLQRNAMTQSTVRCHHLFLCFSDIPKSL